MQANGYQAAIISDDEECSRTLSLLLDSVGEVLTEYTVIATSKDWQEKFAINYQLFVVFIDQQLTQAEDFFKTLHRIQPNAALVLLDLHRSKIIEKNQWAISHSTQIVGTLQWPFKYSAVLNIIHQCQIFYEQKLEIDMIHSRKSPLLFRSLVGISPSIHRVHQVIEEISEMNVNVLLYGPPGSGKEVVARNIHYYSSRSKGPFMHMYCGSVANEIFEQELFGYEKGDFSGAFIVRKGRLELANHGTLFLDEIDKLPINVQEKLAKILKEKLLKRNQGEKEIAIDVRIIATTYQDLEQAVKTGLFSKELYQQLNLYFITVPALKDRIEDLPLLITDLLRKLESENFSTVSFSSEALEVMTCYEWPGNIRELANLINRLAMLYPGQKITLDHLPEKLKQLAPSSTFHHALPFAEQTTSKESSVQSLQIPALEEEGINLKEHLTLLEKQIIKQALIRSNGVVAHAANYLKMRRTTLVEKMKKYKMTRFIKEESDI